MTDAEEAKTLTLKETRLMIAWGVMLVAGFLIFGAFHLTGDTRTGGIIACSVHSLSLLPLMLSFRAGNKAIALTYGPK